MNQRIPRHLRDIVTDDPALTAEFDRESAPWTGSTARPPSPVLPPKYIATPLEAYVPLKETSE